MLYLANDLKLLVAFYSRYAGRATFREVPSWSGSISQAAKRIMPAPFLWLDMSRVQLEVSSKYIPVTVMVVNESLIMVMTMNILSKQFPYSIEVVF